ncbi:hypothetical protein RQP46_007123 [Phenoliferia psychrophenolica]
MTSIPKTAQQWRLTATTGIDQLHLVDFEVPQPGVDEVLVKLEACSLQFRDLLIVQGKYPGPVLKPEMLPGSDAAGTVVAVGTTRYAQKKWTVGDRVAGNFTQLLETGEIRSVEVLNSGLGATWDGVFTQYRVFPASGLVEIPKTLSFEEAATLPCAALTAYNGLYGAPGHTLRAGQWVLALGTGGVSIFAMQFALTSGAHCIITSSSDAKLAKAKEIAGEHASRLHLINYSKTPDWDVEVRKLVPTGVDFVVEVGGDATLGKTFKSIALGGMVAAIGFVGGAAKEPLGNINALVLMTCSAIRGVMIGSRTQFEEMNAHISATNIKPAIDQVFKFGEMKEAFRHLEAQKNCGASRFLSSTSVATTTPILLKYGIGSDSGVLVSDIVRFGGVNVTQTFAACDINPEFGVVGASTALLGLGWSIIAQTNSTPFVESLWRTGQLDQPLFSLAFGSAGGSKVTGAGYLTIGGTNSSLYTGEIQYFATAGGTTSGAANTTSGDLIYPCATNVTLALIINGTSFAINPINFNRGIAESTGKMCLGAVTDGGAASPWIIGSIFMKSYYSVFRYDPPGIGLAHIADPGNVLENAPISISSVASAAAATTTATKASAAQHS